jgi:hypothetical protein
VFRTLEESVSNCYTNVYRDMKGSFSKSHKLHGSMPHK